MECTGIPDSAASNLHARVEVGTGQEAKAPNGLVGTARIDYSMATWKFTFMHLQVLRRMKQVLVKDTAAAVKQLEPLKGHKKKATVVRDVQEEKGSEFKGVPENNKPFLDHEAYEQFLRLTTGSLDPSGDFNLDALLVRRCVHTRPDSEICLNLSSFCKERRDWKAELHQLANEWCALEERGSREESMPSTTAMPTVFNACAAAKIQALLATCAEDQPSDSDTEEPLLDCAVLFQEVQLPSYLMEHNSPGVAAAGQDSLLEVTPPGSEPIQGESPVDSPVSAVPQSPPEVDCHPSLPPPPMVQHVPCPPETLLHITTDPAPPEQRLRAPTLRWKKSHSSVSSLQIEPMGSALPSSPACQLDMLQEQGEVADMVEDDDFEDRPTFVSPQLGRRKIGQIPQRPSACDTTDAHAKKFSTLTLREVPVEGTSRLKRRHECSHVDEVPTAAEAGAANLQESCIMETVVSQDGFHDPAPNEVCDAIEDVAGAALAPNARQRPFVFDPSLMDALRPSILFRKPPGQRPAYTPVHADTLLLQPPEACLEEPCHAPVFQDIRVCPDMFHTSFLLPVNIAELRDSVQSNAQKEDGNSRSNLSLPKPLGGLEAQGGASASGKAGAGQGQSQNMEQSPFRATGLAGVAAACTPSNLNVQDTAAGSSPDSDDLVIVEEWETEHVNFGQHLPSTGGGDWYPHDVADQEVNDVQISWQASPCLAVICKQAIDICQPRQLQPAPAAGMLQPEHNTAPSFQMDILAEVSGGYDIHWDTDDGTCDMGIEVGPPLPMLPTASPSRVQPATNVSQHAPRLPTAPPADPPAATFASTHEDLFLGTPKQLDNTCSQERNDVLMDVDMFSDVSYCPDSPAAASESKPCPTSQDIGLGLLAGDTSAALDLAEVLSPTLPDAEEDLMDVVFDLDPVAEVTKTTKLLPPGPAGGVEVGLAQRPRNGVTSCWILGERLMKAALAERHKARFSLQHLIGALTKGLQELLAAGNVRLSTITSSLQSHADLATEATQQRCLMGMLVLAHYNNTRPGRLQSSDVEPTPACPYRLPVDGGVCLQGFKDNSDILIVPLP